MADFFYETLQKKDSEHGMFIVCRLIPYSRKQKHVSVSDMSRLEAPASWPSLLV